MLQSPLTMVDFLMKVMYGVMELHCGRCFRLANFRMGKWVERR